eukprot:Rmarinus@m.7340
MPSSFYEESESEGSVHRHPLSNPDEEYYAWSSSDEVRPEYTFVQTEGHLDDFLKHVRAAESDFMVIDCEGNLDLLQVSMNERTFVLDCVHLGREVVGNALRFILEDPGITKVIHDVRREAVALYGESAVRMRGVIDTQVVYELFFSERMVGLNKLLQKVGCDIIHPSKEYVKGLMMTGRKIWAERPLEEKLLDYAAHDVSLLSSAFTILRDDWGIEVDLASHETERRMENAINKYMSGGYRGY